MPPGCLIWRKLKCSKSGLPIIRTINAGEGIGDTEIEVAYASENTTPCSIESCRLLR